MRKLIWALAIVISLTSLAYAGIKWKKYDWKGYGISMLGPTNAVFVEKERKGGWAEVYGKQGVTHIYAICKMGTFATSKEIEGFAVKEIGVNKDKWDLFDKGKNSKGWKWYKSFAAEHKAKGHVYLGGYGIGKRGTYLIILQTTEADFEKYEKDYEKWYESIRVY
ncbi:MAG: hypothetical protein ACYTFY_05675 [Planctomycetota bacterium]|jgi:hypothetical protein